MIFEQIMGLERNLGRGSSVRVRFNGFYDVGAGLVHYYFEAFSPKNAYPFTWIVEKKALYLPNAEFAICPWHKVGMFAWNTGIPVPARFSDGLPKQAAYIAANFEDIRDRWEADMQKLADAKGKQRLAKKKLGNAIAEHAKATAVVNKWEKRTT